ncbi:MAG: Asp23/Gls24 family envelope stress response protein [Verrucomicrobia bacterium]|nr:Asp23/Gls24 family envelope stress response protein [Kiritimatiellia bacterium]MCB1102948.1 Asp23/Gls24 family envelope stress response protein [Kiritimatiellia bacterium]MCP5487733.1 Asp23/Gls24 family envelope stress response protein [Verrucomicrobiota bacterium]
MNTENNQSSLDIGASPDHTELSNGDHLENDTELGSVHIHNNVIATIAHQAAVKVPGVVEMTGSLVDGLAGMIGKKTADRGIRVEFEDNEVLLELHVILEYGVRIPHVAWQLQTDVKEAVEQMTGKHVRSIQVIVQGIKQPNGSVDAMPKTAG